MLTAWCLAVAFVSPWLVGIPLLWLLLGAQTVRRPEWLWAPFVGLAGIVCPLQTLAVFADLPLVQTTPWFWATVGALWVVLLARPGGRASLRVLPLRTILLSLGAFLLLGIALVHRGVEQYRGKLHSDQYNYVVDAQFLMDMPFSTNWAEVGERPWLALALSQKDDRMGLVTAHGFFAVTAGRDALDLFFPTLFLSAPLLVLAVRGVALRVGLLGRTADATAVLAALVPGATAIVADCYMAHAIFVPILLAYAVAVVQALRRPGTLPVAAALFSLGFAVYTEFTPILVGVAGAGALAALATRRVTWRRAVEVVVGSAAGVLLNPAAIAATETIAERAYTHGRSMTPSHTFLMMFENVWLNVGVVGSRMSGGMAVACGLFTAACFALAAWGWTRSAVRGSLTRRGPALGAAASLMLLPLAIAAVSPSLRYAVLKLLFTAAPLYVLGLGLVCRGACVRKTAGRVRVALVAIIAIWLVSDTVRFQLSTHRREERTLAAEWNNTEVEQIVARLNAEPVSEVVVALGPDEHAWVPAGAVIYRARQHRIQIASPRQIWLYPVDTFPDTGVGARGSPRSGAIVVTRPNSEDRATGEVLLRTEHYVLIRAGTESSGRVLASR